MRHRFSTWLVMASAAVGGAWVGEFHRLLHAASVGGGGRFFT